MMDVRGVLYRIGTGIARAVRFIFRHKNTVTSVLLPYNLFLFVNLAGVVAAYRYREQQWTAAAILVGIIAIYSAADKGSRQQHKRLGPKVVKGT